MTADEIYKNLGAVEWTRALTGEYPDKKELLDALVVGAFALGERAMLNEQIAEAKQPAVDAAVTGPGIAPPE